MRDIEIGSSLAHEVVLLPRMHHARKKDKSRLLVFLLIGILLVFVGAMLAIKALDLPEDFDWSELAEKIARGFKEDPWDLIIALASLVVSGFAVWIAALTKKSERLIVGRNGIRYISPLPGFLEFFKPGWSLGWAQIRDATLTSSSITANPVLITLTFDATTETRKVRPWYWVDPETTAPKSFRELMSEGQRGITGLVIDEILDSAIIGYMEQYAPHITLENLIDETRRPLDITKQPVTLAVASVFFVLLIYALVDGFIIVHETYAARPLFEVYVGVGLTMAILAATVMRKAGTPMIESVVIAALLGVAFGGALYPGALRLNRWTDNDGLRTYTYVKQSGVAYTAEEADLPTLRFSQFPDYWAEFAPGSSYEFELRKGGLGFYQLNMRPIRADQKAYYRRLKKSR